VLIYALAYLSVVLLSVFCVDIVITCVMLIYVLNCYKLRLVSVEMCVCMFEYLRVFVYVVRVWLRVLCVCVCICACVCLCVWLGVCV
jgi:hypothetical protein